MDFEQLTLLYHKPHLFQQKMPGAGRTDLAYAVWDFVMRVRTGRISPYVCGAAIPFYKPLLPQDFTVL